MKKSRRFLSLLLASAMLLSFWGCQTEPVPQPTEPPSTTETTPPEPTAAEIYEEAVSSLADGEYSITIETTRTTGDASYSDEKKITAYYQNMGSADMIAVVNCSTTFPGDYYFDHCEVYADGTAYSSFYDEEGITFQAKTDGKTFLSRQIPVVLLDTSLYGSIRQEDTMILFSEPSALEDWVAPDYAELSEASGKADLWKDGTIKTVSYEVSYRQGPVTVEQVYTLRPVSNTAGDLTKYLPKEPDAAVVIENLDAPYLMNFSNYMCYALRNCSMQLSHSTQFASEALGLAVIESESAYLYGSSEDFLLLDNYRVQSQGYQEDTDFSSERRYANGTATYIENGGEPITSPADVQTYQNVSTIFFSTIMPYAESTAGINAEERNGFWYITYTANEAFSLALEDNASYTLTSDTDLLDNLASDYKTDTAEGYVVLDKDSLLPISYGLDYQGRHNIENSFYRLYYSAEYTISIGDRSTYTEITHEMFPEEESEAGATPLFYEVTSPDGGKLYLLGTIHVGDERTGALPQEIYDAFSNADALAVECDVVSFDEQVETDENLQKAAAEAYYYTDGSTIADHIDAELYEEAMILAKFTGSSSTADYLRPSVLGSLFTNALKDSSNRFTGEQGVDHRLIKMAQETEKEILEIESVEAQLNLDVRYSDELHAYLLQDALETDRNEYLQSLAELYELWCEGDEAKLIERLGEENEIPEDAAEEEIKLYEEYTLLMHTQRNELMLKTCKEYLESGKTVFVAVGLAHLLASTGLVQGLQDAGYTVTLVQYSK